MSEMATAIVGTKELLREEFRALGRNDRRRRSAIALRTAKNWSDIEVAAMRERFREHGVFHIAVRFPAQEIVRRRGVRRVTSP
jgi:hypothetical protein